MVAVMHKSKFVKSVYDARDDRRVFLISPEMENKLSTRTGDTLAGS